MALLPGWNRDRLQIADPADVEAARLLVFTEGVRPLLERDIEGALEQLVRADMQPKERERREKAERGRARELLQGELKRQQELRAFLELDEPDDA